MNHAGAYALGTFSAGGPAFPGLVLQDRVLDMTTTAGVSPDATIRDILELWDQWRPRLAELAEQSQSAPAQDDGPLWRLERLTVLPPVEPRQVLQSGANYFNHVVDLAVAHLDIARGRSADEVRAETRALMETRALEGVPYMFIGLPTAVTGPFDDVVLPSYSEKNDWELELTAVIGRRAFRVDPAQALEHVAGYTIVNDLTSRDLVFRRDMPEIGTDWFRGKNAPGFLPTGPYIVPADFVGDTNDLQVTLSLNGQMMQNESTSDMIFAVADIISAASQITPLLPGDLILTGSPAGNGMHWGRLLRDGDVMDAAITGLGAQRTRTVAEASR